MSSRVSRDERYGLLMPTHLDKKNNLMDAVAAYDSLAPYYRSYAEARVRFLRRVEEIVIAHIQPEAQSLLDVGSGDGARALRIAKSAHLRNVVLVEPSSGMRAQCQEEVEFWKCKASEIPKSQRKFDVITCLWNVLGHLQGAAERLSVLSRLKDLLSPSGVVFLDVNHRYNAAAYGWTQTLARMIHDFFFRSENNGDVVVSWRVGNGSICTNGHVFTQRELDDLFHRAGLKIKTRWAINYDNGAESECSFGGNLLYELIA